MSTYQLKGDATKFGLSKRDVKEDTAAVISCHFVVRVTFGSDEVRLNLER